MSSRYPLRFDFWDEAQDPDRFAHIDAVDASSTAAPSSPGPPESPLAMRWDIPDNVAFMDVDFQDVDSEEEDPSYAWNTDEATIGDQARQRAPRTSNDDKARDVLQYMKNRFGDRFSLQKLLSTVFTSTDPYIKGMVGVFLSRNGAVALMETLWELGKHVQLSQHNPAMAEWVVDRAAEVCALECNFLTTRASEGPHYATARSLRVAADSVSLSMVRSFKLSNLTDIYNKTTPHLQRILQAAMGRLDAQTHLRNPASRNPDDARTYVTSMILNTRSRVTNFHAVINSLVFWDQGVSKRLVEAFNHMGLSASYPFQVRAVLSLSRDSVRVARQVAADPSNLIMLPYDNFNWRSRAYETSADHGTVQHDQVSAMLVIPWIPPRLAHLSAAHLASVARFTERMNQRHSMPPEQSLQEISVSSDDQMLFRASAITHVATILAEYFGALKHFASDIPPFSDPSAIDPHESRRHYLPTYDQEQASTQGNMNVLTHYFLDVLHLPKERFETVEAFVLGDRLTTARDRAAQDQRAVDQSPFRFDHLASLKMLSGLMHFCLNMEQNLGRNYWGDGKHKQDCLSLSILRDLLPNRSEINTRKYDFYAWLRFLDVVLRALVITASLSTASCHTTSSFSQHVSEWDYAQFHELCTQVVDTMLLPSTDRLEADGIKTLLGPSVSGHAVLLMHDLMTLREMRHAIKHGHPKRVFRILKYWAPMFYAGGGYNYAHETMELLHNIIHDWQDDTAEVLLGAMLVNTTGRADGFKEADIDVEHLNDAIKGRAHGVNASPELLEKTTPAIGEVQHLTKQLFKDLNVEEIYQRHSHVKQHTDINILLTHFQTHNVFNFRADQVSNHNVIDLFRDGCRRLAGHNGGHMKHLIRHKLRLQTRHGNTGIQADHGNIDGIDPSLVEHAQQELDEAVDREAVEYASGPYDDLQLSVAELVGLDNE